MSDPADPLDAAWTALDAAWDDPAKHKAFVGLAASLGRLPDAAARYKTAGENPARADGAERGRQLVVAAALAQIETAPRTPRERAMRRGAWLAPIATLGFLFAASMLLATVTHNRTFVSIPALALEMLLVAVLPWRRILR